MSDQPKVILVIMDGWGIAPAWGGNAIEMAETPNLDNLWRTYPHLELKASEEAVGSTKQRKKSIKSLRPVQSLKPPRWRRAAKSAEPIGKK